MIKTETEVLQMLNDVSEALDDSKDNLTIMKRRKPKVDKTTEFMAMYNITHNDVVNEIIKLTPENYAYTDIDRNPHFPGELWMFGSVPNFIPHFSSEVYIKIKMKSKVICLSFHEAEYPLTYPYK